MNSSLQNLNGRLQIPRSAPALGHHRWTARRAVRALGVDRAIVPQAPAVAFLRLLGHLTPMRPMTLVVVPRSSAPATQTLLSPDDSGCLLAPIAAPARAACCGGSDCSPRVPLAADARDVLDRPGPHGGPHDTRLPVGPRTPAGRHLSRAAGTVGEPPVASF